MNMLKRLMRRFKVPSSYLIKKLLELDEKDKSDSLRAKAIIKTLIKRGYPEDLFNNDVVLADEDEFFEDSGVFDEDFIKNLSEEDAEKLLLSVFGPRKTSDK